VSTYVTGRHARTIETDLESMMGLADRVEAWARRFGVPPPQAAGDDERDEERDDDDTPRAQGRSAPERHPDEERFRRHVRQR
jgi:hypothetical protein